MGRKRAAGLIKRGETWHIDKQIFGKRIRESAGTNDLAEAERFLARKIEELRQAQVYGVRPKRLFREAAIKYLSEHRHKASWRSDAQRLRYLDKYLGDVELDKIHLGTLAPFIEARRQEGVKTRTINHGLKVVRRILNLGATEWFDEHGLTWLLAAPKIKLLPEPDLRKPYPLSWREQFHLFRRLPKHLLYMAMFKVNTGCRDQDVCRLRWEWEIPIPELDTSVFVIPGRLVKNGQDRVIVLNKLAKKIIDKVRGQHPEFVFSYRGKRLFQMNNTGWQCARSKANLRMVRVHDLKHTFGRRLRAAGVSFEDRQDLLGHKSTRITTHYSAAELQNLITAANKVCARQSNGLLKPTLLKNAANSITLLNRAA